MARPHIEELMNRFMQRVVFVGDLDQCWDWDGGHNSGGYAIFWVSARAYCAHRWVYEILNGQVGDLDLDHLCRNRGCVNPTHLEPVTRRINILRGIGPTANYARQTHCLRGHELSGENLGAAGNSRRCLACRRERRRYG